MNLKTKIDQLKDQLSAFESVAVAFSGGIDSSFLTKMVFDVFGENCLALTADSVLIPRNEIESAIKTAKEIGIQHDLISISALNEEILRNDPQRCYYCKQRIFTALLKEAKLKGKPIALLDGSNLDDLSDYRPGMKALKELGIRSPLIDCEFTKNDIRAAAKLLGLSNWNKPSLACMASRIPYYQRLTSQALTQIEKAESYLKAMGVNQLRVRAHEDHARIEVAPQERELFFQLNFMDDVAYHFKMLGFKFVSLDLEGYQTGKMN